MRLVQSKELASLSLVVWMIVIFYNVTEAALESALLSSIFTVALTLPSRAEIQKANTTIAMGTPEQIIPHSSRRISRRGHYSD
jgi:hypothetical protein